MSDTAEHEAARASATIRRAPKLPVFLAMGAMVGVVATFIATAVYPVDPAVGFGALFGYFLLYGVPVGVVAGALVALALDRRSRRGAMEIKVEHEHVSEAEPGVPDDAADALQGQDSLDAANAQPDELEQLPGEPAQEPEDPEQRPEPLDRRLSGPDQPGLLP